MRTILESAILLAVQIVILVRLVKPWTIQVLRDLLELIRLLGSMNRHWR
jgi:hypothetical protein